TLTSLTTGTFRSLSGKFLTFREFEAYDYPLLADWSCSVFWRGSTDHTFVCGSHVVPIRQEVSSICSSEQTVYAVVPSGQLFTVDKKTGRLKMTNLGKIVSLSCSGPAIYCITEEQHLFRLTKAECEEFSLSPFCSIPSMKVKSVACGSNFLLCLSIIGQLYSSGLGSRGQLGLGDLDDRPQLTHVEALQMLVVIQVAAGAWHSACVTGLLIKKLDSGDLYTWGWNEHGQLGHKSFAIRKKHAESWNLEDCVSVSALPKPVDIPEDKIVTKVACGARHTACITDDGEVFVFGWNGFGQLGLPGTLEATDVPSQVHFTQPTGDLLTVSDISCGQWSTSVIVEKKTSRPIACAGVVTDSME
ncbi:regulator of condensation, partial [Opisthorchis viverrini]